MEWICLFLRRIVWSQLIIFFASDSYCQFCGWATWSWGMASQPPSPVEQPASCTSWSSTYIHLHRFISTNIYLRIGMNLHDIRIVNIHIYIYILWILVHLYIHLYPLISTKIYESPMHLMTLVPGPTTSLCPGGGKTPVRPSAPWKFQNLMWNDPSLQTNTRIYIYIYVCMYVCMYVMYVCMYVCM